MPTTGRRRRRIWNTLLLPGNRARLLFFAFGGISTAFVQGFTYVVVSDKMFAVLNEAGAEYLAIGSILNDEIRDEILKSLWIALPIALAAVAVVTIVLHRLHGPLVPIRQHLQTLRAGDYGARCQLRAGDKAHEVAEELNALSAELEQRHGSQQQSQKVQATDKTAGPRLTGAGQPGFSIIELLVTMAVLSILVAIAISQFLDAYDRARQRATMGDMRSMAAAEGAYRVDFGEYALNLSDVAPYYLGVIPPLDRWGNAWDYQGDGSQYTLTSLGQDAAAGPSPPSPWYGDPFSCDLVVTNGVFVQAPSSASAS